MTLDNTTNKRSADRKAVLKGARVIFQDSVFDCVVLNISAKGARVRTEVMVPVPEQVSLSLSDGTIVPALRRWARGTEIGLEFAGTMAFGTERAIRARTLLEILRTDGLHVAVERLRAEKFLDDPELVEAAEQIDAARARLEAVLKARAGPAG